MRESLLAFSMACLCRSRPEEEASRMDHASRQIARFSFINVTHKTVDERCISVDAQ
jgi:hypothetical protein